MDPTLPPSLAGELAGMRRQIAELQQVVTSRDTSRAVKAMSGGWTLLPLSSNFVSYDSGHHAASYRIDPAENRLYMRGLVKTTGTTGAFAVIANLNAALVPDKSMLWPAIFGDPVTATRLDIATSTGYLTVGAALTSGQWVALDAISYSLDPA